MVNYKFMLCYKVLLAAPIHEGAERVTQNIGQAAASAARCASIAARPRHGDPAGPRPMAPAYALASYDSPVDAGSVAHDCPRLVDEAVPGKAAVIDDVVIGWKTRLKSQMS